MSAQHFGKTTNYVLDWCSTRMAVARRELERVWASSQNLVGMDLDLPHLAAFRDELLELRAAVKALSNAADDLERGAAALRDEGQP